MPDGPSHVACVEDYDSDENNVVPGTRRDAGKQQPPSTKPLLSHFHKLHRDTASDSGYSSHTSNTVSSSSHSQPASNFRPQPQPSTQYVLPNHSKPVINRTDSQRHQSRSSRSASMSKPPSPCTDGRCGDPDCVSKRSGARGHALPYRPQSHHAPQHPQTTQYPVQDTVPYPQASNDPYAHVPHGQQGPGYPQQPQPRQHASSISRSRPTSWIQGPGVAIPPHYGMTQATYNAQHHVLQGSPSAYNRSYMGHHQSPSGDWSGMPAHMASGSPRDPSGYYMQGHGMPIPSNGQPYRPAMTQTYSARQGVPTTSSHDPLAPPAERAQPSQPVLSARRRSEMPGSFPKENLHLPSDSETSSESSDSEEEERHHHHGRRERRRDEERVRTRRALENKEYRDRKAMPPPPTFTREQRPTLPHSRTTSDARRTQSREPIRRSRNSEPHLFPSDYEDLDRDARFTAEKRHTHTHGPSRRPSISHRPSSERHRSGSIHRQSHVDKQYIVDDGKGGKQVYNTREEAEAQARRLKQQRQSEEAEAYLNITPALSAEHVKRAQPLHQRERRTKSHVSGSSKKSTASSSRTTSESIQITTVDGTTFNIPNNTTLQIRQTDEGEMVVIGSGSPPRDRDYSYHGGSSKSSGSRVGRRNGSVHGGRRRDTKTEDDGYEPAL